MPKETPIILGNELQQIQKVKDVDISAKLWSSLPPEAQEILLETYLQETQRTWQELINKICSTLFKYQYDIAHQRVIENMNIDYLEPLETEDDIIAAAIALTEDD